MSAPSTIGNQPPAAILVRFEAKNADSSSANSARPATIGSRKRLAAASVTRMVSTVVIIIVPETAMP